MRLQKDPERAMEKVTILTVSYNSAKTIRDTIESVLSQDYPNVEYIIVDGMSTDGTQEIVREYGNKISKFVSEKDKGLYDAMNKGIDLAQGEIIGILNSDDLYADTTIISSVVKEFREKKVDVVYGDLYYFRTGSPEISVRRYKGGIFSLQRVSYGIMPPHPTFFIKKEVYSKYGKFNIRYTLSADFDLILRFLGVHKVRFAYIPRILVKMRTGGKSTSSLKRTLIMNREDLHSCKTNGVRTNIFKFHTKYLIKLLHLIH
jgi:glycosyltransferase involved in cell wall biosynthesis